MNQKKLLALWAAMFILCAGLGFIQLPVGGLKAFLIVAAVAFFIPPALRLKQGADRDIKLVRNLSLAS